MPELAAPPPTPALDDRMAHALQESARPLISLAAQLRGVVPASPDRMKRSLVAAMERFERELAAAGCDESRIAAASYLLCTWVDQVVGDTPWGAGGGGLLERFHGEGDGSQRVLRLLSRLAEQPRENQALLELFHACLCLGLNARPHDSRDAVRRLEQLRARVFLALPQEAVALAPPWRSAVKPAAPAWRRRFAIGALLLLALATLGVYTTSHLLLAARVDEVFASMQRLPARAPARAPTAVVAAAAPAPPRLQPLLADDVAAGRVVVRDDAHRSVVTLTADRLFDAGSPRLAADAAPLLARVAHALAGQAGKVVVIGHTDGRDPRTARLPSAWHQSFEWAREVADELGRELPADRLAVEGAADLEEPATANMPRRRVDVVLFP